MPGFGDQIEAFRKKAMDRAVKTAGKVAVEAFTQVVSRTPVDKGRARASWNIGLGGPDPSVEPEGSYSPDHNRAQLQKLQGLTIEAVERGIFISNSVEYIRPLEYGHSKQAPQGMVQPTLEVLKAMLARGHFK